MQNIVLYLFIFLSFYLVWTVGKKGASLIFTLSSDFQIQTI